MLGDVGHLLLLGQHLNLHLLLFGERHEVVQYVFLVALIDPGWLIFACGAIRVLKVCALG